jgi:hypothetical protein
VVGVERLAVQLQREQGVRVAGVGRVEQRAGVAAALEGLTSRRPSWATKPSTTRACSAIAILAVDGDSEGRP